MTIIPLSEGSFTIDKTKVFVPFNTATEELNNRPVGSLLVEIQPFLVVTQQDIILIDTGLGYNMSNGVPQIYYNLEKVGYNPSQVTKVLMSHLHKDHAGGITTRNYTTSEQFIAFPYATYYIQRREYEYAMGIGSASYVQSDIQILEEFSKVVWLEDDHGFIDNYIEYQLTGAHSKFHQVFFIKEENEIIFFGGDDAPQLQQMKSRFIAKYDFDGKKCMELRRAWWEAGQEKGWKYLFYHDISSPVFYHSILA
jgi:glyoxylase-like metal-dependent hydrolase (beta-lactamase superfamily II)